VHWRSPNFKYCFRQPFPVKRRFRTAYADGLSSLTINRRSPGKGERPSGHPQPPAASKRRNASRSAVRDQHAVLTGVTHKYPGHRPPLSQGVAYTPPTPPLTKCKAAMFTISRA
jgi:hypothetical protein